MAHIKYEIRDIIEFAMKMQAKGVTLYRANIGDPAMGGLLPPQHVSDAFAAAVQSRQYTGYAPSAGDSELREAIGALEDIPSSRVFVTQGLTEGISFLFRASLNPGDNFLQPSPSYSIYMTNALELGGEANYYRTQPDGQPDVEHLRHQLNERTRAIVVVNPNNPTGAVYSRELLLEIIEIARMARVPIIADEIYDQLSFGAQVHPMYQLADDVLLIRGCGISKNFLYPGARVGHLGLHGPEHEVALLASELIKLSNARLSTNWEAQRAALAAYTQPITHLENTLMQLQARRDAMQGILKSAPGFVAQTPPAAFYTFPKVEGGPWKTDKEFAYDLLEATGIITVPGSAFSPVLEGIYARFVSLAPVSTIHEMGDLLARFMGQRLN